ncbi:UNVERIFIED_CONTAM: hypothetical protein ITH36_24995, partial [Salmonella enterica subsp. enterica serovar Weltevreden]
SQVDFGFKDCLLKLGTKESKYDLAILDFKGFDAILGIDWLSHNYVYLDCRGKRVIFKKPLEEEFVFQGNLSGSSAKLKRISVVSALKAIKALRNGCKGFVIYAVD